MKLILVGYMTAGKSTLAGLLAEKLNVDYVDLDDAIAKQENAEVADIIRQKGELYFRKVERKVMLELLESDVQIIAMGGGTPCYYDNMDVMLRHGHVAYLQWSMKTLVERITQARENRPLLDGVEDEMLLEYVAKHVFDRRPYYEQAHQIVYGDGKSVEQIALEILEKWKRPQ